MHSGPSRTKNYEKNMRTSILGCNISETNYSDAYRNIVGYLSNSNKSNYVTVNNVHTLIEGSWHREYKNIINKAYMALPDGKPLAVIANIMGAKKTERVFGPTFFEVVIKWGQKDGLRHFLFGSSQQTLEKMNAIIKLRYPTTNIVGTISPSFDGISPELNEQYLKEINDSNADIVWVALGAPRQEYWMYENYKKLNRGMMIGIGAGFDYFAGNTKHAPEWMKNYSLEWLYRLIQEPRRLWKRYLVTNTLFIVFITLQLMGVRKFMNN